MRKRSICFGGFRKTRRRRRLNSSSACSMKRRLRWRRTARSYAESKRGSAHCAPNMGAPMRQSLARSAQCAQWQTQFETARTELADAQKAQTQAQAQSKEAQQAAQADAAALRDT